MRCAHLNRIGEQCRDQAIATSQLCAYHAGILEGREMGSSSEDAHSSNLGGMGRKSRFPFIYRVAAGLLLLIFLIEIAQSLRGWLDF